MATERWRYQVLTDSTVIRYARTPCDVRRQDGVLGADFWNTVAFGRTDTSAVFLAGDTSGFFKTELAGGTDFAAVRLDASDGNVTWEYQDGTEGDDWVEAIAIGADDSVVMGGTKNGSFAVTKLASNGTELWTWKDGSSMVDIIRAVVVGTDGCVVFAGSTYGAWNGNIAGSYDFAAGKIASDGSSLLWAWQNGTTLDDELRAVAMGEDGSVVIAGDSNGNWDGADGDSANFVAVKLDSGGEELWRWANETSSEDTLSGIAMSDDGSIYLAGTEKMSSEDDEAQASCDFLVYKLNEEGGYVWNWKNGTDDDDFLKAATMAADGSSVFFAGYTTGDWNGTNAGAEDFAAVQLDADGTVLWKWQEGTSGTDVCRAIAAGPDGEVVVAGYTEGVWYGEANAGKQDFAAVMLNLMTTPTPSSPGSDDVHAGTSNTTIIVSAVSAAAAVALIIIVVCLRKRWLTRQKSNVAETVGPPRSTNKRDIERGKTDDSRAFGSLGGVLGFASNPSVDRYRSTTIEFTSSPPPYQRSSTAPKSSTADRRAPALRTPRHAGAADDGNTPPLPAYEEISSAVESGDEKFDRPIEDSVVVTASTAGISTAEKEDLHRCNTSTDAAAPSNADSVEDQPEIKATGIGLGGAVMAAAQELAQYSTIPGVSEAATLVSILVNLVKDQGSNRGAVEGKVRWCRSIMTMLERGAKVLGQDGETLGEAERNLVQDVHEAVLDFVQVIQAYKSKNRFTQVLTSSLFKRRWAEAEALVDRAVLHLHLGLNVQVGEQMKQVGLDVNEGLNFQQRQTPKGAVADSAAESIIESRRLRRQRRLQQIEIPEDHLTLTDELLGKGGFGAVYLADYNGRNAAAKVLVTDHDMADEFNGVDDDHATVLGGQAMGLTPKAKSKHSAFLRELEAMIRLRSPHTVNVYGAVTCRKDRLILVMELLEGGDLRTFLKNSGEPLPRARERRIMDDICTGMAFLHSKETVHGDLKSANVLLDSAGRAKIADFGTTRWAQHTTGLGTYTSQKSKGTQMSFAWAAPEVFDDGYTTYASDVYSFGVVVWEIMTRDIPWSATVGGQDIYRRVVIKGERPRIPEDAGDVADILRACWAAEPEKRPTANGIMESLKSQKSRR